MNVYFCDVCGIRVTDVDLKGGHGMRRRHDVICATCLEMGHGKEWAEKAGLSGRTAVVANESSIKPAVPAASIIDQARDRAATLEDAPAPVVKVAVEAPAKPAVVSAPTHTAAPAAAAAVVSRPVLDVDDDLGDLAPPALAMTKDKAETEPGLEINHIPAAGDAASRRKDASGRHKPGTGKTSKPSSGKTPRPDRSATNRRDQPSSGSPTPASASTVSGEQSKKTGTGSTKRTKAAKSGRNKVQGIPPVIMVTIAGVLVIVLGGLATMSSQGAFSSKEGKTIDQKADLEGMSLAIKDAKTAVNKDPHEATDAQVEQAIASIRSMQSAYGTFANSVKGYWTEAQIDTQLSSMGYADVMGKLKMWNEEKAKRSQRIK